LLKINGAARGTFPASVSIYSSTVSSKYWAGDSMSLSGVNREYVSKLVADIKNAVGEILVYASKPFEELSSAEKYAIRYLLVTVAEALMALAIHLARRALSREPETPIHALMTLRDAGMITVGEYDELVKLRNLLVHRYWVVDDARIYSSIKEDFKAMYSFIERVERFLSGG